MSETVKIILTFLFSSAFIGFIQFLIQRRDNRKDVVDANTELLLGLTRDKLIFLTDKYIERGSITLDELSVVEQIYKAYICNSKSSDDIRVKAGVEKCRGLKIDNDLNNHQYSR